MEIEKDSVSAIMQEISVLVRRATFMYRQGEKLDRAAYLLLVELEAHGPMGVGTLANSFQLDISTASRQIAALEARGFVERFSDPTDRRASLLQITPPGKAQMLETRGVYLGIFSEIFADWPEEDRRLFAEYLSRYNKALVQRGKKPH